MQQKNQQERLEIKMQNIKLWKLKGHADACTA
jgi:hypothetical protein